MLYTINLFIISNNNSFAIVNLASSSKSPKSPKLPLLSKPSIFSKKIVPEGIIVLLFYFYSNVYNIYM
jgi:hypothetical protein